MASWCLSHSNGEWRRCGVWDLMGSLSPHVTGAAVLLLQMALLLQGWALSWPPADPPAQLLLCATPVP